MVLAFWEAAWGDRVWPFMNKSPCPDVIIYTDGACRGNPGPGGYGVVLLSGAHRRELSGGFRRTTNNRMEIMACIKGLEALTRKCRVILRTDSQYVAQAITQGWARGWKARGWRITGNKRAKNSDLWETLLALHGQHEVAVEWVRGHDGNQENERTDQLAVEAANRPDLPPDEVFEKLLQQAGPAPSQAILSL